MAVIYTKLPASGEKCLILNPREEFLQPFSVGSWTELRMGILYSLTSASDPNGLYSSETISYTDSLNGIYIGLKDADKTILPFQSGSHFIGIATAANSNLGNGILQSGLIQGYDTGLSFVATSGVTGVYDGAIGGLYPVLPVQSTGNSSFATFFGLKVVVTGLGSNGQSVSVSATNGVSGAGTNNTSLSYLQSQLDYLDNLSGQSIYYTTGFVNGAGPLPLPTALFVYLPFLQNSIRLHGAIVQRYQPNT